MNTAKPLSLYNTLTRAEAPFVPMDSNNVRLYACGPTVYDFAHIGNGRAAIVFDLLFRLLRQVYGADHVTYVRNITDVDDKINARALRDFPDLPLNEAIRRVTETTSAQYQKDVAALGCLEPSIQPRATDNIAEMQAMIQRLLDNGHAYQAGGEVLFAVESMSDYGQLSGRNLADNLAGARIAVDVHKRNPADFVLWKLSSAEEPGWDSPWGRGRPGWHIECSAMSERYLGETFDIHGGGLDLIFPHHENEIAQSRCAHGSHAMANVWMHNGFLQVEGQKMSKSLGNFFTIHQLLETTDFGGRKWPGDVLRLAMLMSHYREPIDFTVKRLEEAVTLLDKWERAAGATDAAAIVAPDLLERLADDLDTPGAIGRIHALILDEGRAADGLALAELMGIRVKREVEVDAGVAARVAARLAALNARDFAKADAIRDELAGQGIALMDFKDENGERQTKWEVKR
ncbi:cysteine--tRNA ligase [Devosia faecipullorum]|uniref:cysteine--tRNA ligase n=1 Tax=Devosia faecipullorum TaxID=2755039 RepID=UPI00187BA2D5|nr:cysteine--tRNA ligase [Devosia faecipullorum]MBE7733604.1 cysteine--tRNA ligase [Devosia faecipullorum]